MSKFLVKVLAASLIVAGFHLLAVFLADENADDYYRRFTSPPQSSLIVGTSRAAQGVRPSIVNSILRDCDFDLPIFNFAFTVGNSPYGETYLNAIKKKVDPNTTDGLFLVCVTPWSICTSKALEEGFPEANRFVGKTQEVNRSPNIEYLWKCYNNSWGKILLKKIRGGSTYLHEDGWLEVTVSMSQEIVEKRVKAKAKSYREEMFVDRTFSDVRAEYLKATVAFLELHGTVVMIRLPVSPWMADLEKEFMPDFDATITKIARQENAEYLNLIESGAEYQYTDGNHLYKESAKQLSGIVGNRILGLYSDGIPASRR